MNKSKFLKKSLAAVLAVLMIAAMIPLSAAAASTGYKPTGLKITGPNGEVATGSGNSYTLNLNWDKNDPKIVISTETAADVIWTIKSKVDANGNQVGDESTSAGTNPTPALDLEMDDDGNPIPFRFFVKNGSEQSDDITVTWTKASASTSGKATSAKLANKYPGDINDAAKTITFTVPIGYKDDNNTNTPLGYTVNFEGCADTAKTTSITRGNIGTNKKNPVAEKISTETQDGKTTVEYDVIVKEEVGLTDVKFGSLETVLPLATAVNAASFNADVGMETGEIKVYVPASVGPVTVGGIPKFNLVPTFAVANPNVKVEVETASGVFGTLTSGKELKMVRQTLL